MQSNERLTANQSPTAATSLLTGNPTETRAAAIRLLLNKPAAFGRLVGFTKLNDSLHNAWIRDIIAGKGDRTLQAHRGSYKTTCITVGMSVNALLFPRVRTAFMRKTDNDVKEVITQVRKILENPNTQFLAKLIWGREIRLLKSTATELDTNLAARDPRGAPQLTGIGTGGSLTGKHYDLIFTDDIVNVQDRLSRAERERIKIIYQELQNIRNRDGGRIYNTGTPWHPEDAFSIMPDPFRFDCQATGLISPEELSAIRDSMVPSLFAANYELRHIPAEDVIFTNPQTGGDPAKVQQARYCHIDAAYGGADSTAFTICRKLDGKYYVFGKLWHKHVDQVEAEIIRLRKQFSAGPIYCETNADKGYLAKELRQQGERAVEYSENTNKYYKIATYLKSVWKDVIFVQGTDLDYIRQICDYSETAEHDDAPDSLASLIRLLKPQKDENQRRDFPL